MKWLQDSYEGGDKSSVGGGERGREATSLAGVGVSRVSGQENAKSPNLPLDFAMDPKVF